MDGYRYNKKEKGHIIRDDATRMTLGTHISKHEFCSFFNNYLVCNQSNLSCCLPLLTLPSFLALYLGSTRYLPWYLVVHVYGTARYVCKVPGSRYLVLYQYR